MKYGFYEVDAWGDYRGDGASNPRDCTMSGVAKVGTVEQPYLVPNEFICGRLGLLLNLPIPPGVVTETDSGELAYISLRFGPKGERLPPAIPEHLVQDNPMAAAGTVVFDCWITNQDRHAWNLAYSRDAGGLTLFDHGHALFGKEPRQGVQTLNQHRDQSLVVGCIPPHISTAQYFDPWLDRVRALPLEIIAEIVDAVTGERGLTRDESSAAKEFLEHRRRNLSDLLIAGMPKITDWSNV